MLRQGFEPWSSARKAEMIGRTTPTELASTLPYYQSALYRLSRWVINSAFRSHFSIFEWIVNTRLEVDPPVLCLVVTRFAEEHQVRVIMAGSEIDVRCGLKLPHRDDVVDFKLVFRTVVSAVLADLVTFTNPSSGPGPARPVSPAPTMFPHRILLTSA